MATEDSFRGRATKDETGKSCPFCRFPIKERDEITTCGICDSPHHEDCWEENDGCANPACSGGRRESKTTSQGVPSRSGSNLPPKAGPSAKKQRINIDPEPERRPRRERPKARQATTKKPESRSRVPYWVIGSIVGAVALLGVILISSNFGDRGSFDETKCEKGTGKDGIPCYDNGALPNVKKAQMKREVRTFMRGWFDDLNRTQWGEAWDALSGTSRKWYKQQGGLRAFKQSFLPMSKYLRAQNLKVKIQEPSYPKKGVLSVHLSNMRWVDRKDDCVWRQGITWVKWNPKKGGFWMFDPGYWTSPTRQKDWGNRQDDLLRNEC